MKKKEIKEEQKNIDVEKLVEKELEACKARCEELKNQFVRTLADYKNLEHRVSQERASLRDKIKREFVLAMLPVLDNLDQAEVFTKDEGLAMVSRSFRESLASFGVEEVPLLGQEFDPNFAEAVSVTAGEKDNSIVTILQKAYHINGTVIRHGKVVVSKKS